MGAGESKSVEVVGGEEVGEVRQQPMGSSSSSSSPSSSSSSLQEEPENEKEEGELPSTTRLDGSTRSRSQEQAQSSAEAAGTATTATTTSSTMTSTAPAERAVSSPRPAAAAPPLPTTAPPPRIAPATAASTAATTASSSPLLTSAIPSRSPSPSPLQLVFAKPSTYSVAPAFPPFIPDRHRTIRHRLDDAFRADLPHAASSKRPLHGLVSVDHEGWKVLKVMSHSPCDRHGIVAYFDLLTHVNRVRLTSDQVHLAQLVREGQPTTLTLFCLSTLSSHEVTVVPHRQWGGEGLLGLMIQHVSIDLTALECIHVLDVYSGSPAHKAGLDAFHDYLLGTHRIPFKDWEQLDAWIAEHDGASSSSLFVFNARTGRVREISIAPHSKWGGKGALGCELGMGTRHALPIALNDKSLIPEPSSPDASSSPSSSSSMRSTLPRPTYCQRVVMERESDWHFGTHAESGVCIEPGNQLMLHLAIDPFADFERVPASAPALVLSLRVSVP